MEKSIRRLSILVCAALTAGLLAGCNNQPADIESGQPTPSVSASVPSPADSTVKKPVSAESYDAVVKALSNAYYGDTADMVTGAAPAPMPEMAVASEEASMDSVSYAAEPADYSQTNVQVEGVDEGDIIKTDGEYIYIFRDLELVIAKADGENTQVISTTMLGEESFSEYNDETDENRGRDKYPNEMYVFGDRLAIISSFNSWHNYVDGDGQWQYDSENYLMLDIYDISDRYAPVLLSSNGQDGYSLTSRMTGGTLYIVTDYYVYDWDDDEPRSYVPCVYAEGVQTAIAPGDIIIMPDFDSTEYTVICSYGMESGQPTDQTTILGGGNTVYMNGDNLYLASTEYSDEVTESYTESVYNVERHENRSVTNITRFSLDGGVELAAAGQVDGYPVNQFAMDEFDGFLRIATTADGSDYCVYTDPQYSFTNYIYDDYTITNSLYVLDSDMNQISSVDGLAENERIYSVRFDGSVGYFCTYRNIDPLFAVDLSDPANPVVTSETKITGFSQYLHVWSEGQLFGLGQEADEETGMTDGLKLVMFNTVDKTDVDIENTLTLSGDWSTALYNHKAILISPGKNIIAFPVEDKYYIFSYDDSQGFVESAVVDFGEEWAYDARGLYIGDYVYVVSTQSIKVLDMADFRVVVDMEVPFG